jgi:hypothetical protein
VCALSKPTRNADENEWRDFKGGGWISRQDGADQEIKKIWSECLGAFSNSGGGVLIFGIKALRRVATKTDFVDEPNKLADRLIELLQGAVDPPILDVEVRPIEGPETKGFVVCYIPASSFAPHKSNWADRDFYMRTQDGNVSIPTEILRRMFYPRNESLLVPIGRIQLRNLGHKYNLGFKAELLNRGTASAENIAVQFIPPEHYQVFPAHAWKKEALHSGVLLTTDRAIHPDQTSLLILNCTSPRTTDWTDSELCLDFQFRIFSRKPQRCVTG